MNDKLKRLTKLQRVLAAVKASEMARVKGAQMAAQAARAKASGIRQMMTRGDVAEASSEMIDRARWLRAQNARARLSEEDASNHDLAVISQSKELAKAYGKELAFDANVERVQADLSRQATRISEQQDHRPLKRTP
jgi:hypothetical protein